MKFKVKKETLLKKLHFALDMELVNSKDFPDKTELEGEPMDFNCEEWEAGFYIPKTHEKYNTIMEAFSKPLKFEVKPIEEINLEGERCLCYAENTEDKSTCRFCRIYYKINEVIREINKRK